MRDGTLTLRLRNHISEIARLHDELDAFAEGHDLPARPVFQLKLCLEEIVTNVIMHAYEPGSDQTIAVEVEVAGASVIAQVSDSGPPYDPLQRAAPDTDLPLEARAIGGLGVHFVKQTMDVVEYRREADQNMLRMTKRLCNDSI